MKYALLFACTILANHSFSQLELKYPTTSKTTTPSISKGRINDLDYKNGFKEIKMGMSADSLAKMLKGKQIENKGRLTAYKIEDPAYLKVGTNVLDFVLVSAIDNKIYSVFLQTSDAQSSNGLFESLKQAYGDPFQSEYSKDALWAGSWITLSIINKPLTGKANIDFSSNILKPVVKAYEESLTRKNASDL